MEHSAAKTRRPAVRKRRDPIPGGLSSLVKTRRAEIGFSLEQMSKRGGFDRTLAWQIETGKSDNPKVLVLYGISKALDVPFEQVCKAALIDVLARVEGEQ